MAAALVTFSSVIKLMRDAALRASLHRQVNISPAPTPLTTPPLPRNFAVGSEF
jgi:hypothetical protein